MQTIVENASPSPRSIAIVWTMRAMSRSVIPALNRKLAFSHMSQASFSAARSLSISSGVFTARSSAMSSETSTNFARGACFASARNLECGIDGS